MEDDIIIVSDDIEIHPAANSDRYSVVRSGSVYGTYETLEEARELAEELCRAPEPERRRK